MLLVIVNPRLGEPEQRSILQLRSPPLDHLVKRKHLGLQVKRLDGRRPGRLEAVNVVSDGHDV